MGTIYTMQVDGSMWFLHEHPAAASSLCLEDVTGVINMAARVWRRSCETSACTG